MFYFVLLESDEILKFIWKYQGPRIINHVKEEKQSGKSCSLQYQDYYKSTVIKTAWYWLRGDKHATGRRDNPDKDYYKLDQNRGDTPEQWGRDVVLIRGIVTIEKMKPDPSFTQWTEITFRWIVDLNMKEKKKDKAFKAI